jgi:hypothetical protein
MNRIDFYRTINNMIIKDKEKKKLIFYDFRENYYDMKKDKVRIGIKKCDHKKFKILEKKINNKFDIIDMRMSLVYGFHNKDERKELFYFINKMGSNRCKIFLFINNEVDIEKNSKNTEIINKGDQVWIPQYDGEGTIKEIIVKDEEGSEKQYCYNFKELEKELKEYNLIIKEEYSLENLSKKIETKCNFIGEYILQLERNI